MNETIFERIVKPWSVRIGRAEVPVYCRVELRALDSERIELGISGVEGPRRNGDAFGGCGQIVMSFDAEKVAPIGPWTKKSIAEFVEVWNRWHLNGMRAGAPDQEKALRRMPEAKYPVSHYDAACAFLAKRGLLESQSEAEIFVTGRGKRIAKGYRYGSGWVTEVLPPEVIEYVRNLPPSPDTPAWC